VFDSKGLERSPREDHGFGAIRLRTFIDPKASDGCDQQNGNADLAPSTPGVFPFLPRPASARQGCA